MLRSTLLVCLSLAVPAVAASFDPVPAEPGGKPNGLLMRVVQYDGSTNGSITVEVKNPTDASTAFGAQGLFFVPQGDPDHAPQRLGAVGPIRTAGKNDGADSRPIAAGKTERFTLDVYCIDSHRSSPSSETPFRVSKERMPRQLSQAIDSNTKAAAQSYGGVAQPAAKSSVQGEVWKSRDQKWIKLDGEGRQEAGK
jgi:hypothetical protein